MKKSDLFDRIIKDKLSQLPVEFDPNSWDQFSQKLDAQEAGTPSADDRRVDEVVFEKLHTLEAGNRASRWDLLAAKLDQDVTSRRQVMRTRIMEVTLVLLIILTFVQYFGQQTPARLLGFGKSLITNEKHAGSNTSIVENTASNQQITPDQNSGLKIRDAVAVDLSKTTNTRNFAPTQITTTKKYKVGPSLPVATAKPKKSSDKPTTISNPVQEQPAADMPVPAEREELMAALERILLEELSTDEKEDYPKLIVPVNPKGQLSVSMFGSMDYNRIITPSALNEAGEVIDGAFERYELGYSGGLMLSWEKGRWEIGTGAIYSAKQYEPRPLVYLGGSFADGYYGESFKLVELNMLQLPVQMRYNFLKKNKWRAFATAGLSLHTALQANYYLEEEEELLRPQPQPRPTPGGNFPTPADEKKKILSKGLLEGGSIWENGYITGNLGIGLEYFITERIGIFTQPTYQQSLDYFTKGFGPDQDRINTFSIFTGLRVKL